MSGEIDKGVETAEYAVNLNKNFGESHWELAKAYYSAQKIDQAKEEFVKTIDSGYKLSDYSIEQFAPLFNIVENVDNQIYFYELVVKNGTKNYLLYSTLATLYYQKGEWDKAIKMAKQSAVLNPETSADVESFIRAVEKKKNE
jgi:tetratricopeptide (TPR) repeat protein